MRNTTPYQARSLTGKTSNKLVLFPTTLVTMCGLCLVAGLGLGVEHVAEVPSLTPTREARVACSLPAKANPGHRCVTGVPSAPLQLVVPSCGLSCVTYVAEKMELGESLRAASLADLGTTATHSLLQLRQFFDRNGVKAEAVRLSYQNLASERLPAILFTKGSHFEVLEAVAPDRARCRIWDPDTRRSQWESQSSLCSRWQGDALLICP